jgi:hypothetical protein
LRSIGLEPIEWTEAIRYVGEGSPFIGTILDKGIDSAQAIVALFTGDDAGRIGTRWGVEELTPQPRLNVIFEAGMAFGRYPDRTILVTLGKTRPFSDIAGRHVIELTDRPEKRHDLASRLKNLGCAVDTDSKSDWHTEGAFDAAILSPDVSRKNVLLGVLLLVILAALTAFLIPHLRNSPVAKKASSEPPEQQTLTISGMITRNHPPHDGIMVGIIPGSLAYTDNDGKLSTKVLRTEGAYTGVAYDRETHQIYTSCLEVRNGQFVFSCSLPSRRSKR